MWTNPLGDFLPDVDRPNSGNSPSSTQAPSSYLNPALQGTSPHRLGRGVHQTMRCKQACRDTRQDSPVFPSVGVRGLYCLKSSLYNHAVGGRDGVTLTEIKQLRQSG